MNRKLWIAVGLLSILPAALLLRVYLVTLPMGQSNLALRRANAESQTAIAQRLAHSAQLERIEREERTALGMVRRILDVVSKQPALPREFLPLFASLASRHAVVIRSATRPTGGGDEEPDDSWSAEESFEEAEGPAQFSTASFSLDVEGPPECILAFVDSLERHPRPIRIQSAELMRHPERLLLARATLLVEAITGHTGN